MAEQTNKKTAEVKTQQSSNKKETQSNEQTEKTAKTQETKSGALLTTRFYETSVNSYLVGRSELVNLAGYKKAVTASINADIGNQVVVVGIESNKELGKATIGVALSHDGKSYTKPVVTAKIDVSTGGNPIECIDLEKYRAPYYRIVIDFEKDAPKDSVARILFVSSS